MIVDKYYKISIYWNLWIGAKEGEKQMKCKQLFKYLSYLSMFMIMLGLWAGAESAHARILVQENWDSGTPPAGWPYLNAPRACSGGSFNGWDNPLWDYCSENPGYANAKISTAKAYSGTKSFQFWRPAGTSSAGDIRYQFTAPYPTRVFVRFYIYFDSSYVNFNTPISREPQQHFLFTNSALSGTGFRINIMAKIPWTPTAQCGAGAGGIPANQPYAFFLPQSGSDEWHECVPTPCYNLLQNLNKWICVEFEFDAANNKYSVWIDGQNYINRCSGVTHKITDEQSDFRSIQFSAWSSVDNGYSALFWIDDIVVSDSYIGPGSTPPPPSGSEGFTRSIA